MPDILFLCSELRKGFREKVLTPSDLEGKLKELIVLGTDGQGADRAAVVATFDEVFAKSKDVMLSIAVAVALTVFDTEFERLTENPKARPLWSDLIRRLISRRSEVPIQHLGALKTKLEKLMSTKYYASDKIFGIALEGIRRLRKVAATPTTPTQMSAPGMNYGDSLYSRRRG